MADVILTFGLFIGMILSFMLLIRQPNKTRPNKKISPSTITWIIESSLLLLWALIISFPFLNFDPYRIPDGAEFSNLIQTHYIWTLFPRCGYCFLWNGFINGGSPAFAELSGAVLNPFVFIPALIFGVINGAKVTFILSLFIAGLGQHILTRTLGLSRIVAMWSALVVMVGGHLAGKMQNGNLALVLSQACAALFLAAGVRLIFHPSPKSLVTMAVSIALIITAGEGYIQWGTILAYLPIMGLLLLFYRYERPSAWKSLSLAAFLGLLLSSVFLVPLLHFLPNMWKDGDASLNIYPLLEYAPLHLVIRELSFYLNDIMGKRPYPYIYIIYIGWIPLILSFFCLHFSQTKIHRLLWIFIIGIGWIFIITSRELPGMLIQYVPAIERLRHFSSAAGLVIPLILTLAACSLNGCAALSWRFLKEVRFGRVIQTGFLLTITALSIFPAYKFSREFLGLRDIRWMVPQVAPLKTKTAAWVAAPYGYHEWAPILLEHEMKMTNSWRPWHWHEHLNPPPLIEAYPASESLDHPDFFTQSGNFIYQQNIDIEYASIGTENVVKNTVPCKGTSRGGWIDIACNSDQNGILVVKENFFPGWYAWADHQPVGIQQLDGWISLQALSGQHTYQFRYIPIDVMIGFALFILGLIGCSLVLRGKLFQFDPGPELCGISPEILA